MLEQPALPAMNDADLRTVIAAQDADAALIAFGWPACPVMDDLDTWVIGDFELTDDELISLATRRGSSPAVDRVQLAEVRQTRRR